MKKILFCIIVLLIGGGVFSQNKNNILSVEDMHADLDFYLQSLQDIHPNPYIVLSEEDFKIKIDSIKKQITTPLSKKEFYLHLSSMNRYTDLHTRVAGSRKMIKQLKNYYLLPKFSMEERNVYFVDDNQIKQQIKTINGEDINTIIDFFLSRRNLVEVSNEYNFLDILSYWLNEHFFDGTLQIKTLSSNLGTTLREYKPVNKPQESKRDRLYRLDYDTLNSVAIFELNTFMPKKFSQQIKFMKIINSVFDTLKQKNINRLYIDLTCNNGGLIAFEEYLLGYLITDNKAKVSWDLIMKQSQQRRKQRGNFPIIEDGKYKQERHYFYPTDKKNKFKGEVYVIQSRHSFSAASTLASQLQTYRQSIVIGEECQIKAVYTDPIVIVLPHSKFLFSCATGFIRNVGNEKTRGVIPDIQHKIYNPYEEISVKQVEEMIK